MKLKQECVRYVLLSLEEQGFEMTQQGAQLPDIQSALANDHPMMIFLILCSN